MAPPQHPHPEVHFRTSIPDPSDDDNPTGSSTPNLRHRPVHPQHLTTDLSTPSTPTHPVTPRSSSIYAGSYAKSHTPPLSRPSTPLSGRQASTISQSQIDALLPKSAVELEDYGLEEQRDGFFDASFSGPEGRGRVQGSVDGKGDGSKSSASVEQGWVVALLRGQVDEVRGFAGAMRTRKGVRLLKSWLGVWTAYAVCLVPAANRWLGRYNYVMVISALVNHPGRAVGSQIDGAFMTCLGTIAGLSWGSLALYTSTSTTVARNGYGGVLAAFLVIFSVAVGFVRCSLLRFYQAVVAAGVAIYYVCLANTSEEVSWRKVYDYGIPWVLGQVVCLIVSVCVFPSAGARNLGMSLHEALQVADKGLDFPRSNASQLKQELAFQFVRMSTAVRDFTIEITFSRFRPDDARQLRNETQAIVRALILLPADTTLFHIEDKAPNLSAAGIARERFAGPVGELLKAMKECVRSTDQTLLRMAGLSTQARQLGNAPHISETLNMLWTAKQAFDEVDSLLIDEYGRPLASKNDVEAIELFLFVHPVRQAADAVDHLARHVSEMETRCRQWRIQPPSYPWNKALNRSNAQLRHDRGGLNAGLYFRTKDQLERTLSDLLTTPYHPSGSDHPAKMSHEEKKRVRYKIWLLVHRLQGFESRFAFKVTLVTTLLAIPAWLPQSRGWWNDTQAWWTVVTVWLMMHPRVGGTFQDLFARCFCAALGAIWGALTWRAGRGNPYVMAVMAGLFLVPMLFRFTQSRHPRSGFIGCVAMIVVSLDILNADGRPSATRIAWTRGVAIVVGVVAAVTVNWVLWPFVARHELRKSISAMMLHSAILYRGVIAKYVYNAHGERPGPQDVERSEMLEGRLREGFVRMRQLLELTSHEIRLRAPFNPYPYSHLISSLESLFEHLVALRQSSVYFQPSFILPNPDAVSDFTSARRDAVASIIMNLYILATALRSGHKIPRYMPDPAAARKKLLDRMEGPEVEYQARRRAVLMELARMESPRSNASDDGSNDAMIRRRWEDVYHYAYSSALTDIVESLQELQKWCRVVVGEEAW